MYLSTEAGPDLQKSLKQYKINVLNEIQSSVGVKCGIQQKLKSKHYGKRETPDFYTASGQGRPELVLEFGAGGVVRAMEEGFENF